MKFYIATGLERAAEQQTLKTELETLGHSITYDWGAHGSVQDQGPERIAEVAKAEADGVRGADLVVVLLPGGRGTHTELGMAISFALEDDRRAVRASNTLARGQEPRRIVIIGDLADATGRECAFYRHPKITHRFATRAEAVAWLRGLGEGRGEAA